MMKTEEFKAVRNALAQYEANSAKDVRLKTIDEHNAAFRWLVGSLFALNGGAAIALFSKREITGSVLIYAESAFLVGIVLCFVTAILGQLSDRRMIIKSHEWGLYWTTVSVTNERVEHQEEGIRAGILEAEQIGRRGRLAGIFSMGCFLVGCIFAGSLLGG